jgi:hypothetical protein
MRWRTLISSWSLASGLAIAVFPAKELVQRGSFGGSLADRIVAGVVVATIIGFIFLSAFLYLGRPWARRALALALLCFVLAIVAFIALRDWRVAAHDITRVAVYIFVLATPVFLIGVLIHPDVIRAFPPKHRAVRSGTSNT